ncbi:MAG: single-stranded-DNA-specific exonuclease RecJ, partial [Candidatus Adiutrix sp.]
MVWTFRHINHQLAAQLARDLSQPLKLGEFLAARGFQTLSEVRAFIQADFKDMLGPSTLSDMNKATERLADARKNNELIAIVGDYDADGLTAAALLTVGLKSLGHKVEVHIPNRLTDGYGLKVPMVEKLIDAKVTLVVTVDNGISANQAIEAATAASIDVIVTDHHRLPHKLPSALAIINPHRDELWQKSPPAGVGVAFMLLAALRHHYQAAGLLGPEPLSSLMDCLPWVAIGTIADMVPLRGVNRILVRHGLKFLASSPNPGLVALKQIARLGDNKTISPRDVGFLLGPRLNAAGRLGQANLALELLLCDNKNSATLLAGQLEGLNRERQKKQKELFDEVNERLDSEETSAALTVVLAGEKWERGILGLVASK